MNGTCDSCGYEGIEVEDYRQSGVSGFDAATGEHRHWNLCRVCSNSQVSDSVSYNREDAALQQTIAWCTNEILQELRMARSAEAKPKP